MIVPADGRAVLVGVETYDFGPDGDLCGPAADAGRMAELLIGAGLPADRIDLLVATAEPGRFPVPARKVTGDDIYRYFNEELRRHHAEALIVYWSGHGFEYGHQQWVFSPGASTANFQGLDLTGELLPVLAGEQYGFTEQYIFVDACRVRYDRVDLPTGPLGRRFAPAGTDGGHRQHSLLASASGATTANLPARSTGEFSQALRSALEQEPGWPWRTDEILSRIAGATGLPPVLVSSTGPDGKRIQRRLGAGPAPGMIAGLLARVPRMTDPARIRKLAIELELLNTDLRLAAPESPEDLAFALDRSSFGLKPLLHIVRTRPDYFPDVPPVRALRAALEAFDV